jgi:hypothetical protein
LYHHTAVGAEDGTQRTTRKNVAGRRICFCPFDAKTVEKRCVGG